MGNGPVARHGLRERAANGAGSLGGGIYNTTGAMTLDHSEVNDNASTVAPPRDHRLRREQAGTTRYVGRSGPSGDPTDRRQKR
ncbi:hypothetical protein ABZ845_13330 [Streptomyces sp. NPDC047022]|uniref:hypothetical protein n=1 Tax=Streptomyces sp. NPDC047022 TaxID=3155737 RepID=UPI0033F403AC